VQFYGTNYRGTVDLRGRATNLGLYDMWPMIL